jgi:hypothetical protein
MIESCRSMASVEHQKTAPRRDEDEGVGSELFRGRLLVLAATLTGMLSCLPLWLNTRDYPVVPLAPWWPQLSPTGGMVFLVLLFGALIGAVWRYRAATLCFLAGSLFLYCGDQNRGQPWFYLYWVLLFFLLAKEKTALAAARCVVALVYLWAGVQKLNATFFAVMPNWFAGPAQDWGLPEFMVAGLRSAIWVTPFLEVFIGVGVWFSRTRLWAVGTALLMHGASLLFLGPLGHNVNVVVWPWNLAMAALVWVLFGGESNSGWRETFRILRLTPVVAAGLAVFALLPALSYSGRWDSYFSFALYSANLARADVYLTESFRDQLPEKRRRFVSAVENPDPNFQKPFVFEHLKWGAEVLGVPPISEPRAFAVMFREFSAAAKGAEDCHMIVGTREGRALLIVPGAPPQVISP